MPRNENHNYGVYPGIPEGIENIGLSDENVYTGVKAFICDADGTLAVKMNDGSEGTIPVLAGLQYSGDITLFKSTGTTGVTAVTVFY